MSILERSDIATILEIDESDIPEDILTWAEKETEKLLNKTYSEIEETETRYLTEHVRHVNLEHTNVTEIIYIKEDGIEVEPEDYYLYKDEGIVLLSYYLSREVEYEIRYKYGNDSVGDLDRKICFLTVLKNLLIHKPNLFENRKDILSEKIGDYTVKYNLATVREKPEILQEDINRLVKLAGGTEGFGEYLTL